MSANKVIAKNTLFLYFRMVLVMSVTLYTSRIILKELGLSDYGIYSVIGGVVAMFGIFDASMSAATQRYLSFDIGNNDNENLKKTFSTSLLIIIGIAFLVLVLAETVGIWYINNKMVYPPNREFAIKIVYQISVVTSLIGILQVPYNALIISKERMGVYAYISIAEVLLKLAIVFLLVYFGKDKLITYSILLCLVTIFIRIYYHYYCNKHFPESKFHFIYDKMYFKELISYSGWNLFGNVAAVARGQGVNMVLNLFFGTLVNAAYGITSQIRTAVTTFVTNFQVAANPQIIKLYAQRDFKKMEHLINQIAKFSFYLSLILIAPFYLNLSYILHLWLVDPPPYTVYLVRIALLCVLIDSISGPLMTGIQATGIIKVYQIVVGSLVFLNLPIAYIVFKFNLSKQPELVFYIWLAISLLSLLFRLFFLKRTQGYDIILFFKKVLIRLLVISFFCILMGGLFNSELPASSLGILLLQWCLYIVSISIFIYFFGLEKVEKLFFLGFIKKICYGKVSHVQ